MKIVTAVGARPQFIKAASGSRALRKEHTEILVHTGQHHDPSMSDVFFEELEIPQPDYNLGIAGGSHGEMTGRMLIELEKVMLGGKTGRAAGIRRYQFHNCSGTGGREAAYSGSACRGRKPVGKR